MIRPLDGIRIFELGRSCSAAFCTQILGDLGAEVIKIEPPGGDRSRKCGTTYGKTSLSYISFNRGKKSIVLDQKEIIDQVLKKLGENDVIVEDLGAKDSPWAGINSSVIQQYCKNQILISMNGFGSHGRWSSYSDYDGIIQAMSGFMSITGQPGGTYMRVGVPLGELFTGLYGAIGSLAAIFHQKRSGKGIQVELSKLSVMLSVMPDVISKYLNTGITTRPNGARHQLVGYFQPTRTKDGSVVIMATQKHQFLALLKILKLEDLGDDPRFATPFLRKQNAEALGMLVEEKTSRITTEQLMQELFQQGIPSGPIYSIEDILTNDYVSLHKLIVTAKDHIEGNFKTIGFPLWFDRFEIPTLFNVSQPGEYTAEILQGPISKDTLHTLQIKDQQEQKPLAGIRILDLTLFMAGPLGTEILKALGAEVIKVERIDTVSDFSRTTEPVFGTTSAYFMALNAGKKSIGLDLKNEDHQKILYKLVQQCDILAENFRPGVTKRNNINYEKMRLQKPDLIYSSVTGFGRLKNYEGRGCVDTIAQAMSGFMSLNGNPDEEPIRAGSSVADVCASLYETVGILAGLLYREKTGDGCFVDVPMISSMLSIMSWEAAEYLDSGRILRGVGNRDRWKPFSRSIYTSDGAVMIDASQKEDFRKLMEILGLEKQELEQIQTDKESVLEDGIMEKASAFTMTELADACRSQKIPAGEIFTVEQVCRSGYLEEQELVKLVHDSKEGWFKVLAVPMRLNGHALNDPDFISQPGEYTKEILNMIPEIEGLYGMRK